MAINDITLTAGMRSNLLSLQQTAKLMDRTQTRLSTGKYVNTPIDNPINYFAAQAHESRAAELANRKDGMSEAIQTVQAANNGIDAISSLIENARSIAQSALTAGDDYTTVQSFAQDFDEMLKQITDLAEDAGYKGVNLLLGTSEVLTVRFNELSGTNQSNLTLQGFAGTAGGLAIDGVVTGSTAGAGINEWSSGTTVTTANLQTSVDQLEAALETLRTESQSLSSNLNIITVRQDFTTNMINTLTEGAANLTLADTNEEGANMLMLQTRQQLSITSLALASESAQAILRLF